MDFPEQLVYLLRTSSRLVALPGAGVSQESGLRTFRDSRTCQAFFSIGTSGVVQPAATLAFAAHNRGALVIEINAEATPLTPKADYFFQGKSEEILPELARTVWNT